MGKTTRPAPRPAKAAVKRPSMGKRQGPGLPIAPAQPIGSPQNAPSYTAFARGMVRQAGLMNGLPSPPKTGGARAKGVHRLGRPKGRVMQTKDSAASSAIRGGTFNARGMRGGA